MEIIDSHSDSFITSLTSWQVFYAYGGGALGGYGVCQCGWVGHRIPPSSTTHGPLNHPHAPSVLSTQGEVNNLVASYGDGSIRFVRGVL